MRKNHDLQKHTLNLRAGDYEKIADALPEVPTSQIIRTVISRFVDQIEAGGVTSLSSAVEIKL